MKTRFVLLSLFLCLSLPVLAVPSANTLPDARYAPIKTTGFIKKLFGFGDDNDQAQETPETDLTVKYKDSFQENSTLRTQTLFARHPIKYEIRIPGEWKHDDSLSKAPTIGKRLLETIDQYRGKLIIGGGRPSVSIQAIEMEHEILAEHWLQHYIFQKGYTAETPVKATSETEAEAQIIYIRNGLSYRSVMRAYIVEKRLLLVRFDAPLTIPEQDFAYGLSAVKSFNIISASIGYIEEMNEFSFLNRFSFTYPDSWQVRNHMISDQDRMSVEFHNRANDGTLKGVVRVNTYRRTEDQPLDYIIGDMRQVVKNNFNLELESLENSAPLSVGAAYDVAHIERYTAAVKGSNKAEYELWVTVLESEEEVNITYLLTPSAELDYENWARNTRMLDRLLNSVS